MLKYVNFNIFFSLLAGLAGRPRPRGCGYRFPLLPSSPPTVGGRCGCAGAATALARRLRWRDGCAELPNASADFRLRSSGIRTPAELRREKSCLQHDPATAKQQSESHQRPALGFRMLPRTSVFGFWVFEPRRNFGAIFEKKVSTTTEKRDVKEVKGSVGLLNNVKNQWCACNNPARNMYFCQKIQNP